MDSFHRFTLPANPCLAAAFDEVHSSYLLRQLKKSNEGEYFLTMATRFGMDMGNCVLIEDSKTTCDLFEKLGGKAYRTNSEREVLEVLDVLGATRR
jgi:FMN phosphatase YigB (HAD superfamily)